MRGCKNCGDAVHTPDDRTGLIHANGKYICRRKMITGKNKPDTAAE